MDLPFCRKSCLLAEGALEGVEHGDQPLDRLVGVTGAVNRDSGDSQDGASPWASSELPRPCGGVGLEVL